VPSREGITTATYLLTSVLYVTSVAIMALSSRLFQEEYETVRGMIDDGVAEGHESRREAPSGEGSGEGVSPSPGMGVQRCHPREIFEI